jgi:hypothetical protein
MTTTPLAALESHGAGALEPGETFLAGIRVEVPSYERVSRDAMYGVALGSVLSYRDQKREQHSSTIPISGAGAFVGVTERRVLVFASGVGLHPTELLGAVDRAGLTLDSATYRAGLVKQAHVRLLAGPETVLDAVCSARNPDLDALRNLIPAA